MEEVATKLAKAFMENLWLILAMLVAIAFYAFLQAGIRVLSDWFMVTVFKKKLNGNGKNGKRDVQLDELITLSTERNESLKCLPTIAKQMEETHGIVTEKDADGFSRFKVMEKKMREVWNKVIRGVD